MKISDIESIENDIIECFTECINEEGFRDSVHYIVKEFINEHFELTLIQK